MWRSFLLKGTTCVWQVATPRFLHHRQFPVLWLRLRPRGFFIQQTQRLLPIGGCHLTHGHTRTYKKDTKSSLEFPGSPITVTDIKHYLRSKDISFHDGYSCLHIQSIFVDPPARKDNFSLFIDKTTGRFLCKDTLVEGTWEDLQDCLEVMQADEQDFLRPHVLLGYSESLEDQEDRERELREVQRIWSSSEPLTDLPEDEVQLVKTMFQVTLVLYCES